MTNVFNGVDVLQRALDYHLERHNVLASNIAHVDTPGFRPKELLRDNDERLEGTLPLSSTKEMHMSRSNSVNGYADHTVIVEDVGIETGADGNSVSLEREMSKLAANDLRYQGVTKFVSRHLAILRYAADGGGG